MQCPVCGFAASMGEAETVIVCPGKGCGVSLKVKGNAVTILSLPIADDYSYFVLPLGVPDGDHEAANARIARSECWQPRVFSPNNAEDMERTGYFLPYLRQFLFPPASKSKQSGPELNAFYDYNLSELNQGRSGPIPLVFEGLHGRRELPLHAHLLLDHVSLRLFTFGVGFLILRFRSAPGQTYFDQMGMVGHLRLLAPLYPGYQLPRLTMGNVTFTMPQLANFFLNELRPKPLRLDGPASVPPETPLPCKLIYDDRMVVYSFSCLDSQAVQEDGVTVDRWIKRESPVRIESEPLDEHTLAKRSWVYRRWDGYSKDGTTLITFDADEFNKKFLGTYTETYYFDIFLLACLQRITLLLLFEDLADIPSLTEEGGKSRRRLQSVQRELLNFKNQCWFSQITNREKGLDLWRRWQAIFETRAILDEVNEQSKELSTFLRNRTRERVEWIMRAGAFLAATVPLVLALDQFFGNSEAVNQAKTWIVLSLVGGCGLFALFKLARKDRD